MATRREQDGAENVLQHGEHQEGADELHQHSHARERRTRAVGVSYSCSAAGLSA